ncbi:MAG TPA: hypothetical protein VF177_15255 [Anaerolineae bacterium]
MSRLEWILGILLVVLLGVVVVLSLLFWFQPRPRTASAPAAGSAAVIADRADEVAPTPAFEGRTAHVAFAAAQRVAREWQEDAQLLNGSATWPQGANSQELLGGASSWSFTFYSVSAGRVAAISVVEDEASLVSEAPHEQETPPLEVGGWNLDSHEVVEIVLNEGGTAFINDEEITVLTMALSADNADQDGRMKWLASLFAPQNGRSLTVRIDATSGEILEKNET